VVKNRLHIDLKVGGRDQPQDVRWPRVTETVQRLLKAGAAVVREDVVGGIPSHVVMADPEGNEFCVV
jgi:predicted enzyme related to lactoylglutathione lyase